MICTHYSLTSFLLYSNYIPIETHENQIHPHQIPENIPNTPMKSYLTPIKSHKIPINSGLAP